MSCDEAPEIIPPTYSEVKENTIVILATEEMNFDRGTSTSVSLNCLFNPVELSVKKNYNVGHVYLRDTFIISMC